MDSRTQFTFYSSFFRSAQLIKNKSARADLYDAICRYALDGVEPDLKALPESAAVAFVNARPNLEASRRKAKNGSKGGKQSGSKPEANESKRESNGSKPQARGNGKREETATEKEVEKENENEKEYECTPPTPSQTTAASSDLSAAHLGESGVEIIVDMYNTQCPGLTPCKLLSDVTRFAIGDRWKKYPDLDYFRSLFEAAQRSDLLTGRKTNWRADLDWLMQEKNFSRVINGSYDNAPGKQEVPTGASGQLGGAELEAIRQVMAAPDFEEAAP